MSFLLEKWTNIAREKKLLEHLDCELWQAARDAGIVGILYQRQDEVNFEKELPRGVWILGEIIKPTAHTITVAGGAVFNHPIRFCPWCGKDLTSPTIEDYNKVITMYEISKEIVE